MASNRRSFVRLKNLWELIMEPNSITEEIREIRHRLADECGNDVFRIGEELRRREKESGRKVVRLPKRTPPPRTTKEETQVCSSGAATLPNQAIP